MVPNQGIYLGNQVSHRQVTEEEPEYTEGKQRPFIPVYNREDNYRAQDQK